MGTLVLSRPFQYISITRVVASCYTGVPFIKVQMKRYTPQQGSLSPVTWSRCIQTLPYYAWLQESALLF